MGRRLLPVLLVVAACSGGSHAPPAPARFSLHEWGVIAVPRGASVLSGMALSGAVAPSEGGPAGAHEVHDATHPPEGGPFSALGLKPVIYVHLEGGSALDLSVRVGAPGGRMLETLPRSAPGPDTEARWGHLHATQGACTSTTPNDATLCETEDHYCEAREDPLYDANGAACLHLADGTRRNHLFYRARVDASPLPFAVARDGDALHVRNVSDVAVPGPAYRITTDFAGLDGIVAFDPPAPGHEVVIPAATDANSDTCRAALIAAVRARGLDASEATAFDEAWAHLLFRRPVPPRLAALPVSAPPRELTTSSDVLLYLLPDVLASRILPLGVEPRPTAVHRALFVRMDVAPTRDPEPEPGAPEVLPLPPTQGPMGGLEIRGS